MIYPIVIAAYAAPARKAPAHFAAAPGKFSRFQQVIRALARPEFLAPAVIATESCRVLAHDQMAEFTDAGRLLIEPGAAQPAAAVAAALLHARTGADTLVLIVTAGHDLGDAGALEAALEAALPAAMAGEIAAVGSAGQVCSGLPGRREGAYLAQAGTLMAAFRQLAAGMLDSCRAAVDRGRRSGPCLRLDPASYGQAGPLSLAALSAALRLGADAAGCGREAAAWGWRETLAAGRDFRISRLALWPGARLDVPPRPDGAVKWAVMTGFAILKTGGHVRILRENQSQSIPARGGCSVENPGNAPVQLIEVELAAAGPALRPASPLPGGMCAGARF